MRVLVVNDYDMTYQGGAERWIDALTTEFERRHVECSLFSIPARHGWRKLGDVWDPSARTRLESQIAEFEPDVLHIYSFQRELSAAVLRRHDVPLVLTLPDPRLICDLAPTEALGRERRAAVRIKSRFERGVARRNVGIALTPSSHVASYLRADGFEDVRIIPNFADLPTDEPMPSGGRGASIAAIGQLEARKGFDTLIKAVGQISQENLQLELAGDGPERSRLETLAGEDERRRTVFHGWLDHGDVTRLLGRSQVLVVPSRVVEGGGAPIVVIEGMMSGCAVVASDLPGMGDVIVDGSTGVLVAPDDVDALARALERLLNDSQTVAEIGERAKADARDRFSTARAADVLLEIYEEIGAQR